MWESARRCECCIRVLLKYLLCVTLVLSYKIPLLGQSHKAADPAYVLDSRVTLLDAAGEPAPVRRATEDLADDFYKVLGTRPRIVTR
jgi:hypothetical protein